MNIGYEKMLFYNDLLEYQISVEGKKVDKAFKENDVDNLERLLNDYYYGRNCDVLHYDNQEELENAKKDDNYIARLYSELN